LEDVTVTVKDNNGNVVEVNPVAVLDVGETSYTFTFKTPLKADPVGMWTVNGVKFDADAQAAVKAVKEAKNQVELLNALKSPYFTGVNADLIAEYFNDADRVNVATVEDVQKIIDKVNKAATGQEAVKAVKEAKNQVELLAALQNGGFERVNVDLIADYAAKDFSNAVTVEDVQAIIDAVNLEAAQEAVKAADTEEGTALTAEAINKAQALVSVLPEKEDADKAVKKALQDRIDVANAYAKVKGATTQASLLSALKSPVLKLKDIDDSLAKYYKQVFDANKDNITDVIYDLQINIVDAGKTAAITDLCKKISEVTDKTSTADLKALLTELKRLNPDEFKADIIDALLEDYRNALVESTTITNTSSINTIIENVNKPDEAINAVKTAASADDLLKALKDPKLNLKNVVDANKDAYFEAPLNKSGVSYFTKVNSKDDVQKVVNAVNAFVNANKATTATEMRSALTTFVVVISDDFFDVAEASEFIDLSYAAKLEVAEIVLNTKEDDFVDGYELACAVYEAMEAHSNFLVEVKAATTNTEMIAALNDKNVLPEFFELGPEEKVVKAELVLENMPKGEDGEVIGYKTIAEIKAAAGL